MSIPELQQVIGMVEGEGLADFFNCSRGDYFQMDTFIPPMEKPLGFHLPSSSQLTKVVKKTPRFVVGRFRTLEEVDEVIRNGTADMVSMVRAHIADPDIVKKTQEGKVEQIRPCIACNQGCQGGIWRVRRLGCAVNPAAGWEATLAEDLITKVATPKKVLIIGGGPAGLEAARIALLRGHKVTVIEASPRVGGGLDVARRAPKFQQVGDWVVWVEAEVRRLGGEIRLNTYFEADDVVKEKADHVIVATGSMPRMDGLQYQLPGAPAKGVDLPHVLSSTDLIMGTRTDLGKTALVLDTIGHFEPMAATQYLIGKGVKVTFVTNQSNFGGTNVMTTLRDISLLTDFYEAGVEVLVNHYLAEIKPGECLIRPLRGKKLRAVPADTVVLVTPNKPLRGLYDDLKGKVPAANLHLIGDALSPRDMQPAISEGHRTARAIE